MALASLAIAGSLLLGLAADERVEAIPAMVGFELQNYCSTPASDPTYQQAMYHCMGFILGVHDGYRTQYQPGEGPFPYCLPDVLEGQLRHTVVRFTEEHAGVVDLPAASVVFVAFVNAYPCEKAALDGGER